MLSRQIQKQSLTLQKLNVKNWGVNVALSEVWAKGGEGGIKLAEEVIRLVEEPNDFSYAYELEGSIEDKLNQIVQKVYGGKRVVLTANAQKQGETVQKLLASATARSVQLRHSTA